MTAASGSTCGCPNCSPITSLSSNLTILVPNQWRDSIQVGRTKSNYRPEGALGEARILNQRENIALVADEEPGKSMGWCLTSMSGHVLILAKDIVVGHANVAGDHGRPLRAGGVAETGETARPLTAKGTGARFA